jgi:hypothetical protein
MNRREIDTGDCIPGDASVVKSGAGTDRSHRRAIAADLAFIAGILALSALPLVVLRGNGLLHRGGFLAASLFLWIGWVAMWTLVVARVENRAAVVTRCKTLGGASGERHLRLLLSTGFLFAFVTTAFYLPMRLHFWGGYDDFMSLLDDSAVIWNDSWDMGLGRPLLGIQSFIANVLTPDQIEGELYVAVGLCFLNALVLIGIIRCVLPEGAVIAMVAAVLFVVNRAEPLTFFVAWATNFYWMALFWFMLALYLLLISYSREWRWLLSVACASLGAALLTSEGLFPLALIGPLLLYFQADNRRRLLVWTFAWLGTGLLFGVRLTTRLLEGGSYQGRYLADVHVKETFLHAGTLLSTIGSYFNVSGSIPRHWGYWLLALALGVAAAVSVRDLPRRIRPRACLIGMGVAAFANILAIAPFLTLGTTWRTQYFAAPTQAVLVAFGLALIGSLMPRRLGRFVMMAVSAVLVASAGAQAWRSQEDVRSAVRFEKTVHIFNQVHAISPDLPKDTLLLFVLDDGADTPLGVNYHVVELSRLVLGASALQVNFVDPHGVAVTRFGIDGIDLWFQEILHYRYDQVVAFRLSANGTVSLLETLPGSLLGVPGLGVGYAPLARLRPGPITQLRFLRYLPWSERGRDIFDTESGIIFGKNWESLVNIQGQIARWADNDAELIVNPAGKDRLDLCFEIERGPELSERASELVVLDAAGAVLGDVQLHGARQQVRFDLPVDPDRVTPLRLRMWESADARKSPPGSFLVLRCDRQAAASWQWLAQSDILEPADRLELGSNWYALESQGTDTFRWVGNDSEIVIRSEPGAPVKLRLEIEGGPSLGGKSSPLRILGDKGDALVETAILGRRNIEVELPPAPERRRVLRLHVEGGGLPVAKDPRTLNFRVFHVSKL